MPVYLNFATVRLENRQSDIRQLLYWTSYTSIVRVPALVHEQNQAKNGSRKSRRHTAKYRLIRS
jgi:hypothetical protein